VKGLPKIGKKKREGRKEGGKQREEKK